MIVIVRRDAGELKKPGSNGNGAAHVAPGSPPGNGDALASGAASGARGVNLDVKETHEGFLIGGDLSGIQAEELELMIAGNHITITGKGGYDSFTRSLMLPHTAGGTDRIRVEFNENKMTLLLPKRISEPRPTSTELSDHRKDRRS